ncbi:MAG: BACON domain-containing protein [Marinilabiliaceae bacterium]|nr:BACON domain-containing protein [Marinilabiliaceae bacterium]
MSQRNLFLTALLFLLSVGFVSCSDDEVVPEVKLVGGATDIFNNPMEYSSVGGDTIVEFSCNVDWEFEIVTSEGDSSEEGQQWVSLSRTSGEAGTYKVVLRVEKNRGFEARHATIKLTFGTLEKSITINQVGDPIQFSVESFDFGVNGGDFSIYIRKDLKYDVDFEDVYPWLSVMATEEGKEDCEELTIHISKNDGYVDLQATLTIKAGDVERTITINQIGDPIHFPGWVESLVFDFGRSGDEIPFYIGKGLKYDIIFQDEYPWITVKASDEQYENFEKFFLQAGVNEGLIRHATITFKVGDFEKTITIKQSGNPFQISADSFDFDMHGGEFLISIDRNCEYEFILKEEKSWLSIKKSSENEDYIEFKVRIKHSDNQGFARQATITIKAGDSEKTITVNQSGKTMQISADSFDFDMSGGEFLICVDRIDEYEFILQEEASWLLIGKRVKEDYVEYEVIIKRNEGLTRWTNLVVKSRNIEQTINIRQGRVPIFISRNVFAFGEDEDEFLISIDKTTFNSYDISNEPVSWLSIKGEENEDCAEFFVKIERLEDSESRQALLTIKAGDIEKSITITQWRGFVDLGLPSGTLWAICNLGAATPADCGGYYAWGETKTKEEYTSENSAWYDVPYSELQSRGVIDENGNLTAQYDAATAVCENWRMPTWKEIQELCDLQNEKVAVRNAAGKEVEGRLFHGKGYESANTLFVPCAGFRYGSDLYGAGSVGQYWSAKAIGGDWGAYCLVMGWTGEAGWYYYDCDRGQSVRAVLRTQ